MKPIYKISVLLILFYAMSLLYLNSLLLYDEPYTQNVINNIDKDNAYNALNTDVHPPLYFLVQKLWNTFFDSIMFFKALNIIFSLISIIMVYKISRMFLDFDKSYYIILLLIFSPVQIYYATTYRSYALFELIGLFSIYYYFRALNDKKWFSVNILFNIIGLYVHYYFIFVIIVQLGYYIYLNKNFYYIKIFALHSILLLPLLSIIIHQYLSTKNHLYNVAVQNYYSYGVNFVPTFTIYSLTKIIYVLIFPFQLLSGRIEFFVNYIPTIFIIIYCMGSLLILYLIKKNDNKYYKYCYYQFYVSFIILSIIYLLGINNNFAIRHIIFILPIFFILLGVATYNIRKRFIFLYIVLSLYYIYINFYYRVGQKLFWF